jgi:ribose 5-phosphate isomerase B
MAKKQTIILGSDHAGFTYKEKLKKRLLDQGYNVVDKGTDSLDSTDYPDYAHAVASAVEADKKVRGILVCGSGNGVAITANKHAGIRAALCWKVEIAKLARAHNDANVLCLPERFISTTLAYSIVDAFLNEKFEGGRHKRRVNKICS